MSKTNKATKQNNTAESAESKRRQRKNSAQQNNTQTQQNTAEQSANSAEREQNTMTEQNAVQSAENAQNTAEQTAQPAEQTGKRTRAERITERNALLEYMHTLASKYSATIGGASDETMKHRAIQRDKHMIIKLVLSDTSIRVCVKQSDRLENMPGLKKVNYNLPYQFLFKDNSEQTRATVAQIFSVAMSQYTDAQTVKALKKAQKASGKKAKQ